MAFGLKNWLIAIAGAAALAPLAAHAQLTSTYRPENAVSTAVAIVRPSVVAVETRFKEPILNDDYYPVLRPEGPDDFARPLQLLARSVAFTDPVTGQVRRFESERRLEFPRLGA